MTIASAAPSKYLSGIGQNATRSCIDVHWSTSQQTCNLSRKLHCTNPPKSAEAKQRGGFGDHPNGWVQLPGFDPDT